MANDLDADRCWRAVASRDRRFDGRFVTGVLTTGIYCRPGCPARLPKRTNVRFFPSAAAAEASGLRPCKRCRPDASPGSPVAIGTPVTVRRALRLLAEDGLGDGGVEELAGRVGVGARHLRRLFDRHVGAAPGEVARTERVHFARKLLEETSLPATEIALASGFGSVRRFNDAVKTTFGSTPTELRGHQQGGDVAGATVTLRLAYRPPLDVEALLAFLRARATPGVEVVGARSYARTVALESGARGTITATFDDAEPIVALDVAADGAQTALLALATRARRLFDLDADPASIAQHLAADPLLATRVRKRPGLRVPGAWDPFEIAVRAILGQQVTVRGATTLAGRLAERFGERVTAADPALTRLFPARAALARASIEEIAAVGLPRSRAEALHELARAGTLDGVTRGVGPWTRGYVTMREGDPDAWPAGDLALVRAAGTTSAALAARAEAWRPWRAYAAMHLWSEP